MPPECLGYAELVEPGKHIERILSMMQLTGIRRAGSHWRKARTHQARQRDIPARRFHG